MPALNSPTPESSSPSSHDSDDEFMKIRVKILDGGKTIALHVNVNDTTDIVKAKIYERENFPVSQQDLSKRGVGGWLVGARALKAFGVRHKEEILCTKDGV